MKRNDIDTDMDIDQILKNYLPRPSQEQVDKASETVLKRIQSMRFQGAEAAATETAEAEALAKRLNDMHIALLMAVEQMRGQGRPVTLTLKLQEIVDEPQLWGSAILLVLRMFERMRLVSSSPISPTKPEALDKYYYEITEFGKEVLARAVAIREAVRNPTEDFA
jgi:hypothetical protein